MLPENDSHALIKLSRVTGTGRKLFDSSVEHRNTYQITISRAKSNLSDNRIYHWIESEIICVEMSEPQFIQLIAGANSKESPCTIVHVNEKPPTQKPEGRRDTELVLDAAKQSFDKASQKIKNVLAEVKSIFDAKGTLKVSDKEKVLRSLETAQITLDSNYEFYVKELVEIAEQLELA